MKDAITIFPPMSASRNDKIKDTIKKERGRLFDFIKRRVANEADAEDILQDVLYQYITNIGIDSIERTASWLFTVAGNKIIDWYRKKKPVSLDDQRMQVADDEEESDIYLGLEDLLQDDTASNQDEFSRSIVWEELESALADLPSSQRDVFVWHELEDKSFKEIAEMTGVPINTLISRKRYAVLFLRERLRDVYNELLND